MVADELPKVIAARVRGRCETGESHAEVSAWLMDLGYRVSPEEVAVIVSRDVQRHDNQEGTAPEPRPAGKERNLVLS